MYYVYIVEISAVKYSICFLYYLSAVQLLIKLLFIFQS